MGVLVPEGFPMSSLKNDAERLVVQALCDQLTDSWLVMPAISLSGDHRDYEIDIVVAHEREGIAVIEVKGHQPRIENGIWYSGDQRMEPQPLDQAKTNAYELRSRIRNFHPTLSRIDVEHAVAFPNVAAVRGSLPPDAHSSQVITFPDLEDCQDSLELLMSRRFGQRELGEFGLQKVVDLLRPNCEFRYEPEARALLARLRLEEICRQQVQALEGLDVNRQVCVTGGAGTGKTRLACAWARRALRRDERVLLTCFNIPLAESLRTRLGGSDGLRIGAFHEMALGLDGMPPLDIPDDADQEWWDTVEFQHLFRNWHRVTERFDTIIVDEAQDFSPAWMMLLNRLLDPEGPCRTLVVADETQLVYERGWEVPSVDDGWTRCELTANCRNTYQIATMLRQRFGGALAPVGGPESEDLRFIELDPARDADAISDAVGEALDLLEGRDHAAESILIATFTGSVRDRLIDDLGFVRWEDREPMTILCENVHRVKGLEFDHVILVVHDEAVSDKLLYVGASRAIMSLTVIGSSTTRDRLGSEVSRP